MDTEKKKKGRKKDRGRKKIGRMIGRKREEELKK
jgi:hypothetical protein